MDVDIYYIDGQIIIEGGKALYKEDQCSIMLSDQISKECRSFNQEESKYVHL